MCLPPCSTVWHWAQALLKIFFPFSADILSCWVKYKRLWKDYKYLGRLQITSILSIISGLHYNLCSSDLWQLFKFCTKLDKNASSSLSSVVEENRTWVPQQWVDIPVHKYPREQSCHSLWPRHSCSDSILHHWHSFPCSRPILALASDHKPFWMPGPFCWLEFQQQ